MISQTYISFIIQLPYRWNLLQKSSALMYYKSEDRDTLNGGGRVKGKVLVREIAGLHDKYMDYVGTVFRTALSSTRCSKKLLYFSVTRQ